MTYRNIHDFIKVLESSQELVRIKAPVSPYLEISEITDRVSKSKDGGKALLFENVAGSSFPVLINAFGSEKRLTLALGGESPDQIGERLRKLLDNAVPKTLGDKLRLLKRAFDVSRYLPRVVKMNRPPSQEVILKNEEVDLARLPIIHCWPQDSAPFITFPVVFTKSLTSGKRNVGMYRMQVFDKNTTGMHWHIHKDGAHFFREYEKAGRKMEAAVAIGVEPAITYAATAPMPRGVDEMLLAGFIRRKPVTLVPAVTVDIEVPAEAEIILEGYISPNERRMEGPFGDHTGYYSLPDIYPVFHVTAITHRRNAIYSTILVGRPPMEDCYLAQATERIFLPLIRIIMPEISDYWLPWEGVFHNIAVVAIDKEYPGHARKVINGLWGSGQMSFCKVIVVVDDKISLHEKESILQIILSNIDLKSDIFITEGTLDALDHAAPCAMLGGKLGIDATSRIKGEPPRAELIIHENAYSCEELLNRLNAQDEGFHGCRLIFPGSVLPIVAFQIRKSTEKRGDFFRDILLAGKTIWQGIVVFYDADVDIYDNSLILWKIFNNVDPLRDIATRDQLMIIDATIKSSLDMHLRPWPDALASREDIKLRIDARLDELGISHLFEK